MNSDIIKAEEIKIFNEFCVKSVQNKHLTKSEICDEFGFNETQINNIQKKYKLHSPFLHGLYKKPSEEQKRKNILSKETKK